ncbi:MAG TPA: glycosyltransferase [Streptosporangiaceae bacterium]|jgi:glycosyltransferase involved in cell wall biosynthesis
MKVLHVITGLDVGGAELQLAAVLKQTKNDADVVTLYNPGPVADKIRDAGVSVRDLGMSSNTQLGALLRLYKIIKDGKYDVVHAHLYRAQVYARPAARLAGTPVVLTTEHSIGETHIERRKMTTSVRALYLASELFSDATIAVADVVRERLVRWGVPERKITVIPNGLDFSGLSYDPAVAKSVRAQFGIADGTYVIGTLGRLDPNKRIDLAIEAAAPLLGDDCKLLVIGRGEDGERLEGVARKLGVSGHVIFGGYQADMAAMLSAFDLNLTTSLQETFGLSVLEALANGLPVLYTTCPAMDGISTPRARQVEGSVPALRAELAKEIEAGSRPRQPVTEVMERYGIDSVAERIDGLYDRLAARRAPRLSQRLTRRDRRARQAAVAGERR